MTIREKIEYLFELRCKLPFPEYYSHTQKEMYKIFNPHTKYAEDKIVLCAVEEGYEKSLDEAITAIINKRREFKELDI